MSQTNGQVKDPVCGMFIDAASAVATRERLGTLHHFCSEACAKEFQAEPQKYVLQTFKRECCGSRSLAL